MKWVKGGRFASRRSFRSARRSGSPRRRGNRPSGLARSADGTLGAQQKLRVWIRIELGKSLGNLPEAHIPVRMDPATGAALTIDEPRVEERLAGRTAEADEALSGSFREDISYYTESIKQAPAAAREILSLPREFFRAIGELRGPPKMSDGGIPPGDPLLEPVEGVTFDVWIAVYAGTIRLKVPPAGPTISPSAGACRPGAGRPSTRSGSTGGRPLFRFAFLTSTPHRGIDRESPHRRTSSRREVGCWSPC